MNQGPFVIVVGASFLPYWTDKPLAHLFNRIVFKGRAAIISDAEYEFNKAYHTHVVIAIGGPISNRIAGEISLLHPMELFTRQPSRRGAIYWRGGIKDTGNGYEACDPCLLIGGRRIRDTVQAVYRIMHREGRTLFDAFIGTNWDTLPMDENSTWRKKYWCKSIPEPSVSVAQTQALSPKVLVQSDTESLVDRYIDAVKRLKKSDPTPDELSAATNISGKIWRRNFNDPLFLLSLLKAVQKRQSAKYSKTEESRHMWQFVEKVLMDRIEKAQLRHDALARPNNLAYRDEMRVQSPYDDMDSSMQEEICR